MTTLDRERPFGVFLLILRFLGTIGLGGWQFLPVLVIVVYVAVFGVFVDDSREDSALFLTVVYLRMLIGFGRSREK
jgi:hypothetical protein